MAKGKGKGGGKPIAKVEIDLDVSAVRAAALIDTLATRFEENKVRHVGLDWAKVQAKLEAQPKKLASLNAMESTAGEPDVIGYDKKTDEFIFCDCSERSPMGRYSICYDGEGQRAREKKGIFPAGNAIDIAKAMGIEILNETQYRELQTLGEFDTTTSSWILTPPDIRELGGALFADRRFNTVFVYHNTAQSFYGARGFRGLLRL